MYATYGVNSVALTQHLDVRGTPSPLVDKWLPWVYIVLGNLKILLLGTFHDASGKYLQKYLNEFSYRYKD
jgi:hypothetical protein